MNNTSSHTKMKPRILPSVSRETLHKILYTLAMAKIEKQKNR